MRLTDCRLSYKATVIKTVWFRHKHRNQWNRIKIPELNLFTYGQLSSDKGSKNIKDILFNNCSWDNWADACGTMELECSVTPYTKIN